MALDTAGTCEATTVWQGSLIRCRRSVPLPHDDHFGNHGFSEFGTVKWSTATVGSDGQDRITDSAAPTVRTLYTVRVTRSDGVVIFDGAITDNDRFTMEQAEGKSTTVNLTATAAIEGLLA